MLNRQKRRALWKAAYTIGKGTKVPAGVLAKLNPADVAQLCRQLGKTLAENGRVILAMKEAA